MTSHEILFLPNHPNVYSAEHLTDVAIRATQQPIISASFHSQEFTQSVSDSNSGTGEDRVSRRGGLDFHPGSCGWRNRARGEDLKTRHFVFLRVRACNDSFSTVWAPNHLIFGKANREGFSVPSAHLTHLNCQFSN